MAKKSTKAKHLRLIQGGNVDDVKSAKAFTRKDIKEFLAKFAEAILVDQERVNKLPRKQFHALYNNGMWKRNREDHVEAIIGLSITVDEMSKRLLKELTKLAIAYKPEVVKRALLDIISGLATGVDAEPSETASLFFRELIERVRQQGSGLSARGNPLDLMSKWFDYDDPIQIARDCECEYVGLLTSYIERESKDTKCASAARGRLGFIEMRVAREFCDYLLAQRDQGS